MADEIETEDDVDVRAISALIAALKPLNGESRIHVLEFVLKKLGISLSPHHTTPTNAGAPHAPASMVQQIHSSSAGVHDIRTFAAEKKPKTVNEKVAVVGYYLAQLAPDNERRDHLTADDIKIYFIQAGFELPTAPPAMTLANAKNAGYLNAMERGQYRLNAVGHNLVAHKLPISESGELRRKATSRKPTKKKAKSPPKARK